MNRLKEIRKSIGVSQKSVSEDLGIPQNTLSNYESGNRSPSLVVWQVLADYFGVTVPYLQGNPDYFKKALELSNSYSEDISFNFGDDYDIKESQEFYFLASKDLQDLSDFLPNLSYSETLSIKKILENTYFEEVGDFSDEDRKLIIQHEKTIDAYKKHAEELFNQSFQKNLFVKTLTKLAQRDDDVDEDEEINITYKNELELVYYLNLVQDNLPTLKRDKVTDAIKALKDVLNDDSTTVSAELSAYLKKVRDYD